MKYFRLLNGWIRLYIWGLCPHCNHDAPLLYDCPICNYYRRLPRNRGYQTKQQKSYVWNLFYNLILKN